MRNYKGHTLTKRTYEQAALVVQGYRQQSEDWRLIAHAFVDLFKEDGNPRFDADRFMAACEADR